MRKGSTERRGGRKGVSGSDRTRSSGFGWLELGTLAVADLGENRGGEGEQEWRISPTYCNGTMG